MHKNSPQLTLHAIFFVHQRSHVHRKLKNIRFQFRMLSHASGAGEHSPAPQHGSRYSAAKLKSNGLALVLDRDESPHVVLLPGWYTRQPEPPATLQQARSIYSSGNSRMLACPNRPCLIAGGNLSITGGNLSYGSRTGRSRIQGTTSSQTECSIPCGGRSYHVIGRTDMLTDTAVTVGASSDH
jgi:hypothetical protein